MDIHTLIEKYKVQLHLEEDRMERFYRSEQYEDLERATGRQEMLLEIIKDLEKII